MQCIIYLAMMTMHYSVRSPACMQADFARVEMALIEISYNN